jgi:hypothetical protein
MPKATHTHITPTPAPDVAPAAPTASVDAELLALVAEFRQVDAHMTALGVPDAAPDAHGDTWESAGAAVQDRWWEIVNQVIDLPAHTQAGWAAKASMIPAVFRDLGDDDTADHTLALSLVRDMLGQADPGPDGELIRLCDRLEAMNAEEAAILKMDPDAPDRGPFKPAYDALHAEWFAIDARLYDVAEPVTRAGVLAVARAAIAQAPKQADGWIDAPQLAEWLAFTVAEYVAREGVA